MSWRKRVPRRVTDALDPHGEFCPTPVDRRWLWHLETVLDNHRHRNDELQQLHHDLRDTCEHHWRYETHGDYPPLRQCVWCHIVEHTQEET